MKDWSSWKSMPSPESCKNIEAPVGPGVYQIREKRTHRLILFGIGGECKERMKSLFPSPYGTGTRNNSKKRQYILDNWKDLEYHTLEADTREQADQLERILKSANNHLFNT